jgi:Spy/CpxP family protein refolding chaperone
MLKLVHYLQVQYLILDFINKQNKLIMKHFLLAITILFSAAAIAQNNPNNNKRTAEERATRATRMMTANLQLSHEQQSQIHPVLLERERNKDAAREKNSGNREAMRSAVRQVNDNADENLKKVLTEEQFEKLQTLREEQRQKAKERKTGESKDKKSESVDDQDFY